VSWAGGTFGAHGRCVLAPNANMMTLDGTNTWVLRAPDAPDCVVIDPGPPDESHLAAIEACHSVAGDESYILKVRVASPVGLENLLQEIRALANVSTRTTIVLSTPYENRPPDL